MNSSNDYLYKKIYSLMGALFPFIFMVLTTMFFSCTNNTSKPKYEFIMVTPTNPSITMGGQVQFTAIGALFDGTAEDITATVTWSSSNTAVASVVDTVPDKGLADTTIDGIATITASLDGLSDSSTLTVVMPPRGPSSFGFVAKNADFVFEINASEFTDNSVIWTDFLNFNINFFTEWVDGVGVWHALFGSISAGDIADEAQNRGLLPEDFVGFEIYGQDGDDVIIADGTGTLGTLPGAQIGPTPILETFLGMHLYVNGGEGEDEIHGSAEDDILLGGSGDFRDLLIGRDGDDFLDGGMGVDSCSGGKGKDWIVMEYIGGIGTGSGELVDLTLVGVFGNEGQDTFEIIGTAGPLDEFDVMSELALAESFGSSDFGNNEDLVVFP
jgi:Ca2+-binding RTX toxin-like protein